MLEFSYAMNQGFVEVQHLRVFHLFFLMAALLCHPVSLTAAGLLFMPQIHKPALPTYLAGREEYCFFPTAGLEGECQGLKHCQKLVENQGPIKPYGEHGWRDPPLSTAPWKAHTAATTRKPFMQRIKLHGDFPAQGGTQQHEGSKAKSHSSVYLEGSSCTFLSGTPAQEMTNADTR